MLKLLFQNLPQPAPVQTRFPVCPTEGNPRLLPVRCGIQRILDRLPYNGFIKINLIISELISLGNPGIHIAGQLPDKMP
ncbi:hypothetical protein, partial [Thiolapillus sp.]|uniref:hypothetical protein n=1 Tax=Thiolapillus sp. TaxID=2017437 RepID=UPI003AF4EFF2